MTANSFTSQNDPVGAHTLHVIAGARKFNAWMFQAISPFIHGRILEVGSGIGNISVLLLQHYPSVTLSDMNPGYCNYLQDNYGNYPALENILGLDLVAPDFEDVNKSFLHSFDTIILLNVIEHIEDHDQAVKNARSLLSENGRLILLAPAYPFLYCNLDSGLGHFRRYSQKTMKSLFTRNGFSIAAFSYFNCIGIAGWLVFGKLLRRPELNSGEVGIYEKMMPLNKLIDKIMKPIAGLSIICVGQKTS